MIVDDSIIRHIKNQCTIFFMCMCIASIFFMLGILICDGYGIILTSVGFITGVILNSVFNIITFVIRFKNDS